MDEKHRLLLVDNDRTICWVLEKAFTEEGFRVDTVMNGKKALEMIGENSYALVIMDIMMPVMDGLTALKHIRKLPDPPETIIITAHSSMENTVEAMKMGAEDYIVKPFDPEELVIRLKKVIEKRQLRDRVEMGSRLNQSEMDLVGDSPPLRKIKEIIRKISPTLTTVLITGESGTGKEVIARAIHGQSNRSSGPFIAVNIGGVPETL